MDNITNNSLSESGKTDPKCTDMKERAELSEMPVRDEVIGDNYNERSRNENEEEGDLEDSLRMQLWTNELIMREIMSHLDWRELLRCELVCRLWRDAVKSLQRVNLRSYDFTVELHKIPELCDDDVDDTAHSECKLVSYLPVQTRPMFVIVFPKGYTLYFRNASDAPCSNKHKAIEAVQKMLSNHPCLLALGESEPIYNPLPTSRTFQYTMPEAPETTLVGLYLPKMPNVNYRTVQYHSEQKENFYSIVDDICTTDIIKGVVVFGGSEYLYEENLIRDVLFNYIKNKQPSIPYALGGCDALGVVGSVINWFDPTLAVFSVPKEPDESVTSCQFNMYSLLIDSTVKEEAAIQKVIQTFAGNISELQYSAALMLSRKRSDKRLYTELKLFRASFPRTTVVGRNSRYDIIGYNHPEIHPQPTEGTDRLSDNGDDGEPEFVYNDSTVFIYFSWGKQRNSGVEEACH